MLELAIGGLYISLKGIKTLRESCLELEKQGRSAEITSLSEHIDDQIASLEKYCGAIDLTESIGYIERLKTKWRGMNANELGQRLIPLTQGRQSIA